MTSPSSSSRNRLSIVMFAIAGGIALLLSVMYIVEIALGYGSPVGSWVGAILWAAIAVLNVFLIVTRSRR